MFDDMNELLWYEYITIENIKQKIYLSTIKSSTDFKVNPLRGYTIKL